MKMVAQDYGYMPGVYFAGTRKDGRFFKGQIEKVSENDKGTLIVIKVAENQYKSLYMSDITFSDCRSYSF